MNEVVAHRPKIQGIIKGLTGSPNEDLEQDVYVKIYTHLPTQYQEKGTLSAWIKTIAANVCRDYMKSSRYKADLKKQEWDESASLPVCIQTPEDVLTTKERQRLVLAAVDRLPKALKKTIELYEFESFSYDESATRMRVPVGTVRSRLFQARRILSIQLQQLKGK